MSISEILKRVISRGNYDATDLQNKMDVYLLYNRITVTEYDEIMGLMNV